MSKNRGKDKFTVTGFGTLLEDMRKEMSTIAEQVADLSNWRFEVKEEFRNLRDQMDMRFIGVEVRLDKVDNRLDKVEGRLGRIEDAVSTSVPDLNHRVSRLETKIKI